MTIPSEQQLRQMGLAPRMLGERLRERSSRAFLTMGFASVVASVISLLSIGLFIGAGSAALFVLGAAVYSTRTRWKIAIGRSAWSIFCLLVLVIGLLHD